ncbi:MAG: Uma2 family endonuclease [Acidobacteriaceae bacterium]|nr:Uma2 family endonuclease [Acidobacteriaceae bacterium]MBV9780586.1 Uma2 family endonuclease [Acidobacteriaceae bacterium]
MGTTSLTVSMEDYLSFEAPEGTKDELIEGEIVISPSGSPRHALVIKRLVRLLDEMLEGADFEVNSDLSIVLDASNPVSMPRPDAFVMDRRRFLAAAERDVFPAGAPELAVEVVSPGNTKKELLKKIRLYLRHGSSAVWVVYPKTRTTTVWESEDTSREFRNGETVMLPHPLPQLGIRVSEIFSVLP